jgi:dynein heavy chain 2
MKTGLVVRINCTPDTNSSHVMTALKSSCTLISSGSTKVMRSPLNNKVILYIRHLELLRSDKWQTKSLIAFLTQLISYNGMYDETNFEWIQLNKFQVVATCADLKYLDTRLISLMHVIDVQLPPINEIETILLGRIQSDSSYSTAFIKAFVKMVHEINVYIDDKQLDLLRIGVEIINALNHYNEVNNSVLRYEFRRAFQSQIESDGVLEGALSMTFGPEDKNIIYASLNGSAKLLPQTTDQFISQIKRTINSWVNETEIQDPRMAFIPETISLFAEANAFLSEDENNLMKGLVLVGNSGCGRKIAIRATSHSFGFDTVWSPRSVSSEKHLSAELQTVLFGEEEQSDKKILVLIDEMHIKLMPHLRDKIYAILHQNNIKSMIRIVLTLNSLNGENELMWSRICHIHFVKKWSNQSLANLPKLIIPDFVTSAEFSQQFYKIYELFETLMSDQRRYIAFIHTFAQIISEKLNEMEKRREHLKLGVAKLDEASTQVEKLKSEAFEQKELLANKRQEADDALNLITSSMHATEDQKVELEEIKSKTEKETAKLKVRKREIDAELKEIEPVLMAAKAAVGGIKSESLAEIRSLRAPPEVIRDILEGVLRLMGVNDTSWVSMKSFLSRRGVKDEIMNFESRKITPDMRIKVCLE